MSYASLLINTCKIIKRKFDKWGQEKSRTTISDVRCRIEYRNRLVRDDRGEEIVSNAQVFFMPDADIAHKDLLEFDSREHSIILITRSQDSVKIHHLEVDVR